MYAGRDLVEDRRGTLRFNKLHLPLLKMSASTKGKVGCQTCDEQECMNTSVPY